ncbi:pentapeptide repeat-containing protein [Bordetella genomosp. 11]|uniref:Pentapeptide repeat-containing protein n=1 Tax=Bordetella genomosp. 11 TaxID=1416808 RepID=A0A261UI95_9BORD|nr:pentapeptide repeat-containing protein [Bordetella genomosp. 11]OZI61649.1 hypothetical protein CAL28_20440 [Bordetella genomosp. 11]
MQLSLATFIPCIEARSSDADPADNLARRIENTVRSVAKTARLGRDGQQALLRWSVWAAYATALDVYDPHLSQQPGWRIVLPIDDVGCKQKLHRLLLRAGESAQTAQDAVDTFYKNNPIPTLREVIEAIDGNACSSPAVGASLRETAWREWHRRLPQTDLPEQIVPFEMLPAPFREVALSAADLTGKDCRNTPGLARLDLSYLYAPDADFQGCDLSDSNFFEANLSGSNLTNTKIRGTILPATAWKGATGTSASLPRPSAPPRYPETAQDDYAPMEPMPAWREGMLI